MRFAVISSVLALAAAGGCKVSVNDLIKKPGGGGSGGSAPSSSSHASAGVAGARDLTRDPIVVEAAEGAPKIGPTHPAWCDAAAIAASADVDPDYYQSLVGHALDDLDRWEPRAIEAAKAACAAPDGQKVAIQTGYLLQLWANQTGQTADELVPYVGFAVSGQWEELQRAHCATLAVGAEAGKRTALLAQATATVFECGQLDQAFDWQFDRGAAAPSELLRAVAVRTCFGATTLDPAAVFQYGVCGQDARALDARALDKQIAGYSGWAQAVARQYHARTRLIAARYERAARAMAKEDPIWQALLFDVPAQAWKDWEADYQRHRAAIDAAFAYEDVHDGPSKQAAKGCLATASSSLAGYVAGAHAKDLAGAKQALMSPVGNVLVRHVAQCLEAEGDTFGQNIFEAILHASPAGRGPRHAMSAAVLDALVVVKSDRSKFPAELSWFRRYVAGGSRELLNRDLTSTGYGGYDRGGIIKSIAKDGGFLRVEFKADKHRERESWCEDTAQIIGWFGDGRPQYAQKCGEGKMITVDLTHQALLVAPAFGAALAPGQFVRWSQDTNTPGAGQTAHGLPIEIWSDADKHALVGYAGLAL